MESVADHDGPSHSLVTTKHLYIRSPHPSSRTHKAVAQMTNTGTDSSGHRGSTASTASTISAESIVSSLGPEATKVRSKDGANKVRKGKAKALYFWNCDDVNKWLRKHCGPFHRDYGDLFREHDITGRSLVRLTEWKLQMIGMTDAQHREDLMRHIIRLKLKTEAQELKNLDKKRENIIFRTWIGNKSNVH